MEQAQDQKQEKQQKHYRLYKPENKIATLFQGSILLNRDIIVLD